MPSFLIFLIFLFILFGYSRVETGGIRSDARISR
jgi:hypothetical protein